MSEPNKPAQEFVRSVNDSIERVRANYERAGTGKRITQSFTAAIEVARTKRRDTPIP